MDGSPKTLRRLLPAQLKSALKAARLDWKLRRAVRAIAKLPLGQQPTTALLRDLQAGWGNEDYAARTDFLEEVARRGATSNGPILECGSGLTTILLALLAGRRGVKVHSLEHNAEWYERVNKTLARFQLANGLVHLGSLRKYDDFDWYDPPLAKLPSAFDFVICDGPPGDTRGGRYGLLPVVGDRLGPGSVILLDDTERAGEVEVLRRWASMVPMEVVLHKNSGGSFAVITRDGGSRESVPFADPAAKQPEAGGASSPLVSIIIPAYNVATFIGETLESVFAQTFTNYEVIVINDGSPDTEALEAVLEPFAARLRYLKQANAGASAARNHGLRVATGEFIAFLDADDVWLPSYLAEQLEFLRQRKCELVCADALLFGESPQAGQTYMETLMATAPSEGEVTFLELIKGERSLITSGIVVRRDLLLETGPFDEALHNAQDFDLWLRFARRGGRLAYHRTVLLRYRCRPNSLTGDAVNSVTRELEVLDKVEDAYDLTPAERVSVLPAIRARKGELQFELGKLLLVRGDVPGARAAFAYASKAGQSGKALIALWFSRLAPGLFQALYLRHLQSAPVK